MRNYDDCIFSRSWGRIRFHETQLNCSTRVFICSSLAFLTVHTTISFSLRPPLFWTRISVLFQCDFRHFLFFLVQNSKNITVSIWLLAFCYTDPNKNLLQLLELILCWLHFIHFHLLVLWLFVFLRQLSFWVFLYFCFLLWYSFLIIYYNLFCVFCQKIYVFILYFNFVPISRNLFLHFFLSFIRFTVFFHDPFICVS